MKKITTKIILASTIIFTITCSSQINSRTVTKTVNNGHSMYLMKGPNDKTSLNYIDDEKKPFTGKFIELNSAGDKIRESTYLNGLQEGLEIEYENRQDLNFIKKKGTYIRGKLTGEYVEYWRENIRKKVANYNQNGILNGKQMYFYSGETENIESIQYYINGKRDGKWNWFYESGKVSTEQNFKNDLENGMKINFYPNEIKQDESTYINNKKHGKYSMWFKNGQLKYTCEYILDKKNGKEFYYFENGQIQKEGNYVNGGKKGRFVWYKIDGTVEEETIY
jgi:antitoxin component YwqK of YwqJK toxin-antitoxin module